MTKVLENKYVNIDEDDYKEVQRALDKRQLAGTAEIVKEYETTLEEYFGVKHALAVSSGTAALHLLMFLYDVGEGDEVILPPTAPVMSALPIIAVGATPVFADNEPSSFGFDVKDLSAKISKKTKAIVSVPMFGYPMNIEEVVGIAKEKGVPLIEDASHCHGAKINNHYIGTFSDVSFFSTQERKLVTTGEGGFILTNNSETANRVEELRDFGKTTRTEGSLVASGQYGFLFGLNFRIAAMSAALGISQLKKLDGKIKKRTENADTIRKGTKALGWLTELSRTDATPNYYSMVFRSNHSKLSAYEVAALLSENNIISDSYRFGNQLLYDKPVFSRYQSDCLNSRKLQSSFITVPTHEGLSSEDLALIISSLREI